MNPTQSSPFINTCDMPSDNSPLPNFEKQIINANNCLEDLMEKTEELLSKAEKYPEIFRKAKELNQESAHLRREEPKKLDEITANDYAIHVKQYEQEAKDRLNRLNQLLLNTKITTLTKEKNNNFIETLTTIKEEFSQAEYPSVVNFYQQNIDRFTELNSSLKPENIEDNDSEWQLQRAKFVPIHEQFLKLKDASHSMRFFIKVADEVLKNNIKVGDSSDSVQEKLKVIAKFLDEKPNPKQLEEIEEYVNTIQEFLVKMSDTTNQELNDISQSRETTAK